MLYHFKNLRYIESLMPENFSNCTLWKQCIRTISFIPDITKFRKNLFCLFLSQFLACRQNVQWRQALQLFGNRSFFPIPEPRLKSRRAHCEPLILRQIRRLAVRRFHPRSRTRILLADGFFLGCRNVCRSTLSQTIRPAVCLFAVHVQSELVMQIVERRIRLSRRLAVRLGVDVRMTGEERRADLRRTHYSLVLALGELVADDAIGLFRLLARARERFLLLLCQRGRLRLYRFFLAFLLFRWYSRSNKTA